MCSAIRSFHYRINNPIGNTDPTGMETMSSLLIKKAEIFGPGGGGSRSHRLNKILSSVYKHSVEYPGSKKSATAGNQGNEMKQDIIKDRNKGISESELIVSVVLVAIQSRGKKAAEKYATVFSQARWNNGVITN